MEDSLINLEKEKAEVKKYEKINQINKELKLEIENYKLNIESFKEKLDLYNKQLEDIERNKIINTKIEKLEKEIKSIDNNIENINEKLNNNKSNINILINKKKEINDLLVKFKEQKRKEELFKEYSMILNRDGLPTYLLKRSIDILNKELDEMLVDVDFTAYFDEDLKLRMSEKINLNKSINAIESSGMERMFISLALKIALRSINNNTKSNVFLIDEATGRLSQESVDNFIKLLNKLKSKIEKILIIEHNHEINSDYGITVEKNEKGISSLKTDF
jgi:DNA repair exonuclease SbcCD ATPase subunit